MLIISGRISAIYTGRLHAELSPGDATLLIRDGENGDRSVLILSNSEGVQPKNWMPKESEMEKTESGYVFTRKTERLEIFIHEIYLERRVSDELSPKLEKVGSEIQFADLLAENLEVVSPGLSFIAREHRTAAGPIDILAHRGEMAVDPETLIGGRTLYVIEVKRRKCTVADLYQIRRYTAFLNRTELLVDIRGILVGPSATRPLLEEMKVCEDIEFVRMSFDQLKDLVETG